MSVNGSRQSRGRIVRGPRIAVDSPDSRRIFTDSSRTKRRIFATVRRIVTSEFDTSDSQEVSPEYEVSPKSQGALRGAHLFFPVYDAAMRPELTVGDLVRGVLAGERTTLARAITLTESGRSDHREMAAAVLDGVMEHTGNAVRVGITGVPGVGKSTFIDQFGTNLTATGHRLAVLAVDPSSQRTGGSILGDKTRMERLAVDPAAFIRPSPAGATLGGVTRTTREAMLLCEAAGFDVILVETVGVGQSETIVSDMVDFFLVLMLPGAGDELQGIKKGVLELADLVAVNKADGDNGPRAQQAASDYRHALHLMAPATPTWTPPVTVCSGLTDDGLDEIWQQICVHHDKLTATGELAEKRRHQQLRWMWSMVNDRLMEVFRREPAVADHLAETMRQVEAGALAATVAADDLMARFERSLHPGEA
ncbi:MAG: methylmalonyl Co-A mutase-associated GTPase MeaB [Acidimicrobiales bacterium]